MDFKIVGKCSIKQYSYILQKLDDTCKRKKQKKSNKIGFHINENLHQHHMEKLHSSLHVFENGGYLSFNINLCIMRFLILYLIANNYLYFHDVL